MRSHEVTKGVARAPHRSLMYAMGYLPEDLEKPLIGVVCAHNEIDIHYILEFQKENNYSKMPESK